MKFSSFVIIHSIIFLLSVLLNEGPWYFLLLTAAQLVYVPLVLQLIMKKGDWFYKLYPYVSIPAYTSVFLLQVTGESSFDVIFAGIYLFFTVLVAAYGCSRFLSRGFRQFEEFAVDMGLLSLMIGGAWFFAHIGNIETGFSPIIRWLTGIHFHYSSYLLPIFAGFLGRISKPPFYRLSTSILIVSPMIVALGITYSVWLELLSVLLYIAGIYGLIYLSFKVPLHQAKWLIRLSFSALGITILFSLAYALGNGWGVFNVSINFMLKFHGILNCGLFALFGVIGWSIFTPSSADGPAFPISKVRGKRAIGEKILDEIGDRNSEYQGLVDNMGIYEPDISLKNLSKEIISFYENTNQYRLFAEVKWHSWFKPFAFVYRLFSRQVKQINLPFSSKQAEMTGRIYPVKNEHDDRESVRAWVRKMNGEIAFVALYSYHRTNGKTYMNIALPLPRSAMIGILELKQYGQDLQLSSQREKQDSDAGVYLTFGQNLFKLPIEEIFHVRETDGGRLTAKHKMWIFRVPFLTIHYSIERQKQSFSE
ncbi:YndJ family protein [Metabacillus idriensis]|uniref:YndJ family protein n=1 Tax=Metabacillus idriensis TaxID=324768 RepID=UPI002812BCAD|nr:YndJ family protein [Metabacillus idriensis]MDR0136532.1 YndJ family protein [Metabacillus idriensis]